MDCFQSWPQTIFHCSKRSYQVRDSFLPTVRRLQCRVFQMTLDVIDFFLLEILRPILWGALNLHFICAYGHHHGDLHRQSLANVFQAAGRFDAAKQHRRSISRFADHGSVQWPLLYGPETVRVPTGNAVKVSPTFFVGVSLPDIFFTRRSPLTSASGHSCHCDRTNVSYLEHDANYLTDPQCTTTRHSSASHANDNNANTTTDHCFNLQVQHATMPSTTGALRSSCVLTSKSDTELQAETRCHDAVEPLLFPALLHGMLNRNCHTSILYTKKKHAPYHNAEDLTCSRVFTLKIS